MTGTHYGKQTFKGQIVQTEATIAAAATTNLATLGGNIVSVTGNTTITGFGTVDAGTVFVLTFSGTPTITYNVTSLILPGAASITAAAGDVMTIRSLGSGNWRCLSYEKIDGTPVAATLQEYIPDSTYPAGQVLSIGSPVFIENAPTTAQATIAQNIGDVASNTRISFPVFGSGVASTILKLNLAKVGSPSVDIGIRIEEDNGSGSPNGVLVHANATDTITPGSLTVSLADTTCTLVGSVTITAGQKCHIVIFQGTYGAETVNGSNYYKIGFDDINTTTRMGKYWNGSAWGNGLSANEAHADTQVLLGSQSEARGYKIKALKNLSLSTVTRVAGVTGDFCRILKENGTFIQASYSVASNIFTFSPAVLLNGGENYFIEIDTNGGPSYTVYQDTTPVLSTKDNIEYTGFGSQDGVQTSTAYNIASIQTVAVAVPFAYTSSDLFTQRVLSECDADFSYKIDCVGFSQEAVTAGDLDAGKYPEIAISGIDSNQAGMTQGDTLYLKKRYVGVSNSSTILQTTNNYGTGTFTTFGDSASALAFAGQTFTTVTDFILRSITVPLRKSNAPTDNVVMKLYEADLSTLIATSATVYSGTVLTTSYVDYAFAFDDIILKPGVQYFIRLSRSGAYDVTNIYHWGGNTAGGYAGGSNWYWSSSRWTEQASEDHAFTIQMGTGTLVNISNVAGTVQRIIGEAKSPTKIEIKKDLDQDFVLFERVQNAAAGSVTYNHNLGKIPNFIKFDFGAEESASGGTGSGFYKIGKNQNGCYYTHATAKSGTSSTYCIYFSDGAFATDYQRGYVSAITAESFTITWETLSVALTGSIRVLAALS